MEEIISQLEKNSLLRNQVIVLRISRKEAARYNDAVLQMFRDRGGAFEAWKNNKVEFKFIKK